MTGQSGAAHLPIRCQLDTVFYPLLPEKVDANCLSFPAGRSRPGILVLINDADWELEGEEEYELQNGDNILFVSTLHGG